MSAVTIELSGKPPADSPVIVPLPSNVIGIIVPYTIVQVAPLGTVTVMPEAIVEFLPLIPS